MNFNPVRSLLDDYVDQSRIPGYSCLIFQNGKELEFIASGMMDVERHKPVGRDTIFRIYSMTKPLTSVAMMQLCERGLFAMDDPVERFIPQWSGLKVFDGGDANNYRVKSPDRAMTILDLFTHTSGLTYDFMTSHPVDELYRRHNIDGDARSGSLEQKVAKLAELPLLFSPGTQWNYSISTDVLGYLVQILSGSPLDRYIADNITGPLGMADSGFQVSSEQLSRFAACYQLNPDSGQYFLQDDPQVSPYLESPQFVSGGGGMVSTCDDYLRFCRMLMAGGELDGERILSTQSISEMTRNHLPGQKELVDLGPSVFAETPFHGIGFGLGFSVVLDTTRARIAASAGDYGWGGMASTYFWIDPEKQLTVVFLTQLIPSHAYPLRSELRTAVHNAL